MLCKRSVRLVGLLFGCLMLGQVTATSQTVAARAQAGSEAVDARVRHLAMQHHGKVAMYAENLRTGQVLGIGENTPVQTASVIKLTILFTAMEQVRAGSLRLETPVVLRKEDQVGGSGVLALMDTPLTLTVRDLLLLMITQSDNTATNLMIDTVGLGRVNAEIQQIGLKNTWLYKKISKPATEPMPADQKIYGLGKTTAREMAAVLTRMYRCEFVGAGTVSAVKDGELCATMMGMLQKQFYREGLPRLLEAKDSAHADAAMGNKTGSLDAVRNDVGIVSTKAGPVVMAIFTYENQDQGWSVDNEGEWTIAKIAEAIVSGWSPQGLDPEGYKPAMGGAGKR